MAIYRVRLKETDYLCRDDHDCKIRVRKRKNSCP
jgi:hypothetical protein